MLHIMLHLVILFSIQAEDSVLEILPLDWKGLICLVCLKKQNKLRTSVDVSRTQPQTLKRPEFMHDSCKTKIPPFSYTEICLQEYCNSSLFLFITLWSGRRCHDL